MLGARALEGLGLEVVLMVTAWAQSRWEGWGWVSRKGWGWGWSWGRVWEVVMEVDTEGMRTGSGPRVCHLCGGWGAGAGWGHVRCLPEASEGLRLEEVERRPKVEGGHEVDAQADLVTPEMRDEWAAHQGQHCWTGWGWGWGWGWD